MKKFINKTEDITKELLEGYVLAYQDRVKLGGENIVVRTQPKSEDKVAIVTMRMQSTMKTSRDRSVHWRVSSV